MKHITALLTSIVLTGGITSAGGQDTPAQGHEWLQQLAGEWETDSELVVDPNQQPMKVKGKESARSIGGLWIVAESKASFSGVSMTALTTIGYDKQKKKYVGTFISSMQDYLWQYEGTVDSTGKILTLNAEGPNMQTPGKLSKYKDVYEIKGKDHKVMTSSMEMPDGKWVTFATVNFRRTKEAAK